MVLSFRCDNIYVQMFLNYPLDTKQIALPKLIPSLQQPLEKKLRVWTFTRQNCWIFSL